MASPSLSDAQLIARCVVGDDRHAFAELVRRHQSAVRACLRKLTSGNIALADDLAQETFIQAMTAIGSLKKPEGFKSWLFTIARNQALNRLEREKRVGAMPTTITDERCDPERVRVSQPCCVTAGGGRLVCFS